MTMIIRGRLSHEICLWAFGEGYEYSFPSAVPDKWNKLHSDIFEIHGSDSVEETQKKIIEAFTLKKGK